MPFKSMSDMVDYFRSDECDAHMLFLHIREPNEIQRAKEKFNAKTILITRNSVKHITSNMADRNVFNYDYDLIINNDGSLDEFDTKANDFVKREVN